MNKLRQAWNWYKESMNKPLFTSVNVFIMALVILISYDLIFKPCCKGAFWENFDAEIHGVFLDIIVVVLIYNWINSKTEKRQRIERYKEELEDYRPWQGEEATVRIRGILRRLNKLGIYKVDLWRAYLKGIDLHDMHLEGSSFFMTNFENALLYNTHFEGGLFPGARFQGANLNGTYFNSASCEHAQFEGAFLQGAHLQGADLRNANFEGANLENADLSNAMLYDANFKNAKIELIQLIDCIGLDGAIMMDGTIYDASWEAKIEELLAKRLEEEE